jgi:GrpB-like predicted nucleotidyltransferase (UPF0157 family)
MSQVQVVPYQPDWPAEYRAIAAQLESQLGSHVERIDHIGSTSVPGLAAKDVIDIQLAVTELSEGFRELMETLGYKHHPLLTDKAPADADAGEFRKQVFTEPNGQRRANIHVRRLGATNMRRALLFRDYLCAHPTTAAAYGLLKQRLAAEQPDDREFYYAIKDPVFEIIWEPAERWAAQTEWSF